MKILSSSIKFWMMVSAQFGILHAFHGRIYYQIFGVFAYGWLWTTIGDQGMWWMVLSLRLYCIILIMEVDVIVRVYTIYICLLELGTRHCNLGAFYLLVRPSKDIRIRLVLGHHRNRNVSNSWNVTTLNLSINAYFALISKCRGWNIL